MNRHLKCFTDLLFAMVMANQRRKLRHPPLPTTGGGDEFASLDALFTKRALDEGLHRIHELDHPVPRGVTWAALATYHQFYFDGNKRAGRYTMNTVLMSHGYDAILIRESQKAQYEDVLIESYRTGDLAHHVKFLIGEYNDQ